MSTFCERWHVRSMLLNNADVQRFDYVRSQCFPSRYRERRKRTGSQTWFDPERHDVERDGCVDIQLMALVASHRKETTVRIDQQILFWKKKKKKQASDRDPTVSHVFFFNFVSEYFSNKSASKNFHPFYSLIKIGFGVFQEVNYMFLYCCVLQMGCYSRWECCIQRHGSFGCLRESSEYMGQMGWVQHWSYKNQSHFPRCIARSCQVSDYFVNVVFG